MPRCLAFYLPQYHPIAENDQWWGAGFTEWRNVARARPLLPGHLQPHIPTELGFYDLRVPEVREAQAQLAAEHGIDGFVYYHYWFGGHRLLERPFEEVLRTGSPDRPFALCWANENWTRIWDGGTHDVLISQNYSDADDRAHIRAVASAFEDPRYVRVEGKPLFLVYAANALPNARRTTEIWREEAQRLGLGELYLARVESFREHTGAPADLGFDAAVEFQPAEECLGPMLFNSRTRRAARRLLRPKSPLRRHQVFDYETVVKRALARPQPSYPRYPCVMPGWDNSPRRSTGARILVNSSPMAYERWLTGVLERGPVGTDGGLLFVNAWNEWAEGNYLEPDERWGRRYLEAHQRAIASHCIHVDPAV